MKKIYIILFTILFYSCETTYHLNSFDSKVLNVNSVIDSTIYNIIQPYQNEIEEQMNETLVYTKNDLTKGRPQSTIGNFVTDLCLNYCDANICVFNNGGLRTTIDKGDITRGKIFELMPFENELVILELNKTDFIGLLNYISLRGGEPFSGLNIKIDKNNNIIEHSWPVNFDNNETVKVLTSDYLANGGDKMSFFKGKKQHKIGLKLRDAIIDYCEKNDTIDIRLDNRIEIINN
ncbi:MAG: 5'-nucleotidase C-terminal domain-containing protein [Flavobacteriales bacterium]|nr:5'-nucleotidase C-terminal domain-containing protein [Flavobacteriales bacterium]MDG1934742.1 5'-nucleotidase C-terminal domain-containing protein [Flavobacteriales bacterium]MDG2086199.1 5'-nucleotidase C-terminal domain-containing protein [Flavobacteriales bacterium]